MESRMALPNGVHDHDHGPNNVGLHPEGEDEHRHEKKSVLKKVKDKAKKLKEKVLHGHGQNEHQEVHEPDDHDLYEEDGEEGAEMVEDPEVHGPSGYGSASLRKLNPWTRREEEDELAPPKVLLERTDAIKEVPHAPVNSPASIFPADPVKGLEEDPHAPKDRLVDRAPSNYQTKVTDPAGSGGKEAGITPNAPVF
ncbi:hypothetical protein OIU77_007185 [Salix suchowensis]|uniref:Uncharacterized protein n=1 Tax=Salix suchowensis TaxID=1278906 RepID=A0ABQ9AFG6_9ROSI|nr:hypothetical protein OIU77_007185 [Salix suchowensis]